MSNPKVMIAVPMMGTVCAEFFASAMNIQTTTETQMSMEVNSLVYDSRNKLSLKAIENDCDYILWIDSDMTFDRDVLIKLLQDAEELNADFITALFFMRSFPIKPVILKSLKWGQENGEFFYGAELWEDYPRDQVFETCGGGMACTLVKVSAIKEVAEHFGMSPFTPLPYLSEDYSFCWRLKQLGKKMYCDSRIKVGHVGSFLYDEAAYIRQKELSDVL